VVRWWEKEKPPETTEQGETSGSSPACEKTDGGVGEISDIGDWVRFRLLEGWEDVVVFILSKRYQVH
jgi:hypothetical protein